MSESQEDLISVVLPTYYRRLFPTNLFIKWLSYGKPEQLDHREFSFTLTNDVYIRFQSFETLDKFVEELYRLKPIKIDIGAIYNKIPSSQQSGSMIPVQRELVFDIDMTDYDEVRTCCAGTDVCEKCWKFMKIATKVLSRAFQEDFGFKHLLWVFSGRRGIHCWVCDESARMYPDRVRQSVGDYLYVANANKGIARSFSVLRNPLGKIHFAIQRAIDIIKPYFNDILQEQDFLGTDAKCIELLKHADISVREKYENALKDVEGTPARWQAFVDCHKQLMKSGQVKKHPHLVEEMMLYYCYPRLDINVTRSMNHLLKAPFCVHPKSGKISVPFNAKIVDKFDLDAVPTIFSLIEEIDTHDKEALNSAQLESTEVETTKQISTLTDFKKTSLRKYLGYFKEFLDRMDDQE